MGMSATLNSSFVLHSQRGCAFRSKSHGELDFRCGGTCADSNSGCFPRDFGVICVSASSWCRERSKALPPDVVYNRSRSRNGLNVVSGLGRSLGSRTGRRGLTLEQGKRKKSLLIYAAGDQKGSNSTGDDPVETLFMRELRRRGISSDGKGSTGTDTRTKPTEDDDNRPGPTDTRWSPQDDPKGIPPPWTGSLKDDQRKRSMALNSEGLEGLIPRASELLKLGGSVWIVFWPLILASLATFITLYVYFGSNFLHTGKSIYPAGRPPYVEPYQLLEEEVIPPEIGPNRVPYRSTP
ncbi:hypothetical protein R1sor_008555 [Riccia sorocarpa]|uniref:Uncharacterized protein n=1 Tax=Riccia sorocarpa TaxID=122646 RepID=A0ABD3HX75_9MARC